MNPAQIQRLKNNPQMPQISQILLCVICVYLRIAVVDFVAAYSKSAEDFRQLLRRNYLELIIRAVARILVFAPSSKLRRVTKAAPLHMIVGNFDYKLRTQRLPR